MNAAWRIFGRDFRRLWPLSFSAVALMAFLACFPRLGRGSELRDVVQMADVLCPIVVGLMMVVLMHTDVAVTDRGDWITRPISGGSVVCAKLLYVFWVLALPAGLLSAMAARSYGVEWSASLQVGARIGREACLLALLVGLLGALTPSLLAAVTVFGVGVAGSLLLAPYAESLRLGAGVAGLVDPNLLAWAALCATIILLIYHYRRRSIGRTLAAGAGWVVFIAFLPGTLRQIPSAPPEVSFAAKSPRAFFGGYLPRPFPLGDRMMVGVQAAYTVPAGADAYIQPISATFTAAGGERLSQTAPFGTIRSYDNQINGLYTLWYSYPNAARRIFGIEITGYVAPPLVPVLSFSGSQLASLRGARGVLDLQCVYGDRVVTAGGSLPLRPGALLRLRGHRIEVLSVRATAGPGIAVAMRETSVNFVQPPLPSLVWALVDPSSGEVSLMEQGMGYLGNAGSLILADGSEGHAFNHRWRRGSAAVLAGVDAGWLKSARLEYFTVQYGSSSQFHASIPDFTFPSAGGAQ